MTHSEKPNEISDRRSVVEDKLKTWQNQTDGSDKVKNINANANVSTSVWFWGGEGKGCVRLYHASGHMVISHVCTTYFSYSFSIFYYTSSCDMDSYYYCY